MLVLVGLMLALTRCACSCAGAGVRLCMRVSAFVLVCVVYVCFPVCGVLSTGNIVLLIMLVMI